MRCLRVAAVSRGAARKGLHATGWRLLCGLSRRAPWCSAAPDDELISYAYSLSNSLGGSTMTGHFAADHLHFNARRALDLGACGRSTAEGVMTERRNRATPPPAWIGLYLGGQPQHNTARSVWVREGFPQPQSAFGFHPFDRARSARICEPPWSLLLSLPVAWD